MRHGWNLDPESWKLLARLVSDLSWKRVPFERVHSSVVPKKAGIYLICANTPVLKSPPFDAFFNVLYAGLSTTSIHSRFVAHCSNPDENILKAKQCYGFITSQMTYYYATTTPAAVAEIENRLIDCFGPSCNRQSGISPVITAKLDAGKPAG